MTKCKICGREECDKHTFFIAKTKKINHFSGSSPPEIFIGRWHYPNVYAGILSPEEYGDTSSLSSPEIWHQRKLSIQEILQNRNKLIYGRSQTHIKALQNKQKFISVVQEVAMTHKPIAAEFTLKKPISTNKENDKRIPLISKAGEIQTVKLQENPSVKPKVDYLVGDTDLKSAPAIIELDKSGLETSSIIKILSAGLLGLGKNRKLVPTKWAITATDDTLSKEKLKKIRFYSQISDILLFTSNYLGNHYEFLFLPDNWSFEVIEILLKNSGVWQDYESFFPRKKYADDVTGAYYVNRLAACEYLEKIKKQASVLVLRQISNEYSSPLGVGILRQTSREAFLSAPEKFNTLQEALKKIQERIKIPILEYTQKSHILKNNKKQSSITQFF